MNECARLYWQLRDAVSLGFVRVRVRLQCPRTRRHFWPSEFYAVQWSYENRK